MSISNMIPGGPYTVKNSIAHASASVNVYSEDK